MGSIPVRVTKQSACLCKKAGAFSCVARCLGRKYGNRTARAGRPASRPAKTPLRGVFRAREIPRTVHIRRATFCGGVKTPPYRIGRARSLPKSAKCREVLRAACMRPLRIDRTRSRPKNDTWGKRAQQNQHPSNPFACRCRVVCRGRIYAARQGCAARGVCGAPAVCPGLQGRVSAVITKKRELPQGFAGRMHAAPTDRGGRAANRAPAAAGRFARRA